MPLFSALESAPGAVGFVGLSVELRREILLLSEEQSRSGEEVLPKRELANTTVLSVGSLA
ncbi:hypothetical protein DEO72_LG5g2212 [Vigna unguiculata]|uniref:Uncharacterized protein n=1 Tax=Vigna unguiculata TaxID=3917 RepID=A0A4D6M057_VIGUN|nr:hypothetical protein DEO72_LG5g2212 [Vigna unguiculata]